MPLSVPTDDEVLEPVLRCERSESLPLCLVRLLDFLNMMVLQNESACLFIGNKLCGGGDFKS